MHESSCESEPVCMQSARSEGKIELRLSVLGIHRLMRTA